MHNIKIGTLVAAHGAKKMIPRLIPYGFETFALTFWENIGDCNLEEFAKEVNQMLEGTGCTISCLSVFGNALAGDEGAAKTIASFEALIDHAHLFGTNIVTGFTGRVRGKAVEESIPVFKEVFTPLTERAKAKGVKIAFENCNMGGDWESGDHNIAFCTRAWKLMFEAVPADNLGLQWEPTHHMTQLVDPIPQLRKWIDKVFIVHGKDATIAWDVIKEKGIKAGVPYVWHRHPGFGDTNWTDIISMLRMAGYEGTIDIEGWHDPVYKGEMEYVGQVHALNYLKNCRGGAEWVPNLEAE